MAKKAAKKTPRAHRQVVVYMDEHDRALLERVVKKTGLPRTEVFRRGLRRLAEETLGDKVPGFSLAHLIATATDDDFPPDAAERHDYYLYGGGYEKWDAERGKVK